MLTSINSQNINWTLDTIYNKSDNQNPESEIQIVNVLGQNLKTIKLGKIGEQYLDIDGLSKGHYTIIYLENGKILTSKKVIVE